jgi:hypothetical protein
MMSKRSRAAPRRRIIQGEYPDDVFIFDSYENLL